MIKKYTEVIKLKKSTELIIDKLFIRYSELTSCPIKDSIEAIVACYKDGKLLFVKRKWSRLVAYCR